MKYSPDQNYYPTNPAAAICEFYEVDWDEYYSMVWAVDYGQTISHTVESRSGATVHISLYRMPSGSYEAVTYRC